MSRVMKESGIEWIGEIPDKWHIKRLKYGVKIRNCRANSSNSCFSYIGLENIESFSGKLIQTDSNYDIEQALLAKREDVLFGKLRPYLAKIYYVENDTACSGEFAVFYDFEYSQSFLRYQLLSHWFVNIVDSSTYGTKMPRANIDFIRNLSFLFPSESEQNTIAEYLDKQCSKIDRLIALQEEMIEELQAYKQSVITEAVTKGLDPNVPMKDSGVEWIGMIPEKWKTGKLGMLASIVTGNTPSKSDNDQYYDREGLIWIKPDNLYGLNPTVQSSEYLNNGGIELARVVEANTPLVCCIGSIGKYGYCSRPAAFNQQINAVIFNKGRVHWKYGLFSIASQEQQHWYYANGNVIKILNTTNQKQLVFTVPTYEEQEEIVKYLDDKCETIDHMISLKQSKIEFLKEFKKSLIHECVTGKRELCYEEAKWLQM